MTLKTTLPSDDEIKKIADELDGLEETFSKSQKRVLEEFGYDHSIAQNEVFVPYDNNWYKSPFKLVTAEQLPEFLDNFTEELVILVQEILNPKVSFKEVIK